MPRLKGTYNIPDWALCPLEYGINSDEYGLTDEDIAQKMNIRIHTVKKHFHSIYTKMNVRNRVQMIQSLPVSTNKIDFDAL